MRVPRLAVLALTIGLTTIAIACNDSVAPKPAIARIEMKEKNLFVFSGRKVPLYGAFVAYDAAGHKIDHPSVSVQLPSGWTRKADTLFAPQGESRGTLKISGILTKFASLASEIAYDIIDPMTDTAVVNSVYDLRNRRWRGTSMCRSLGKTPNGGYEFAREDGFDLDSAKYVATVDTVFYPEDSTAWLSQGFEAIQYGYAQIPWTGYEIRWRNAGGNTGSQLGGRDSLARTGTVILWAQRPDSMWFRVGAPSSAVNDPAVRDNPGQVPRVYRGATWCNIDIWSGHSSRDPLLLEQIP